MDLEITVPDEPVEESYKHGNMEIVYTVEPADAARIGEAAREAGADLGTLDRTPQELTEHLKGKARIEAIEAIWRQRARFYQQMGPLCVASIVRVTKGGRNVATVRGKSKKAGIPVTDYAARTLLFTLAPGLPEHAGHAAARLYMEIEGERSNSEPASASS